MSDSHAFEVEDGERSKRSRIAEPTISEPVRYGAIFFAGSLIGALIIFCIIYAPDADRIRVPESPLTVTFLHLNDHHGHLQAEKFDIDVSNLKIPHLAKVRVSHGGFPMLVRVFHERAGANSRIIKLHAGDALTGTAYYSQFKGTVDAYMLSLFCLDAFALGNHEFDDGDSNLAQFIANLHAYDSTCPDVPVLASNVIPAPESKLQGRLKNYTIKHFGNEKVGIVGIDVRGKTMASSRPDNGTVLTDEVTAAQWNIDELELQGINKIVLLSHIGYDHDKLIAAKLRGVDVIIGGDSHSLLGGPSLTERDPGDDIHTHKLFANNVGDYPTKVTNKDGDPVCIAQAWEYGHLIGELNVSFDKHGVITSCSGKPIIPFDSQGILNKSSDKALDQGTPLEAVHAATVSTYLEDIGLRKTNPDQVALAVLEKFQAKIEQLQNRQVGTAKENICIERFPGQGRSELCNAETWTYGWKHGSAVAGVIGRAYLHALPTADIALVNAGSARQDFEAGTFSYADVYEIMPFGNTLAVLTMTGEQIKGVMEDALSNPLDNDGSTGSYPYAAGLRFSVNANNTKGSRYSDIEVKPKLQGEWTTLEMNRAYNVVTTAYLAAGTDGYDLFKTLQYQDSGKEYAQCLIDYVSSLKSPLAVIPESECSTQKFTDKNGCDHSTKAYGECGVVTKM